MKTSNLSGVALDWAVAKCEGVSLTQRIDSFKHYGAVVLQKGGIYSPSTDWAQGGPIIERESITIRTNACVQGHCAAFIDFGGSNTNIKARQSGPTPLIATMRCYVASKLGDEIDIPEELK